MSLLSACLLAVFFLMLVGFRFGAWPFDGAPGQYGGMLFLSSALTLGAAIPLVSCV